MQIHLLFKCRLADLHFVHCHYDIFVVIITWIMLTKILRNVMLHFDVTIHLKPVESLYLLKKVLCRVNLRNNWK